MNSLRYIQNRERSDEMLTHWQMFSSHDVVVALAALGKDFVQKYIQLLSQEMSI